jgi:hypothetical protein
MQELILQNIVEDLSFDTLPAVWQDFDFKSFSKNKTLYEFQQNALRNAVKALWRYYSDKKSDKEAFFSIYKDNGIKKELDYSLKKKEGRQSSKILGLYDKDFPVTDDAISFQHFINRMSFWMATGSGKTLIIVKLLEMLKQLCEKEEMPSHDILFLAHREDLLEQFKAHIDEFNTFHRDFKITLRNLKEYEEVKKISLLPFHNRELTVFYYRSDLLSDVHKENIVDFRNYDNNGKWYILLDEAHKGDKEDSKRQIIYSILSRNGFLFNFSATFTDPRDYATCAFNYNLSKFVEDGYGKHIYLSEQEVKAFRDKTDFAPIEKQRIVLKTLLLLAYINKYFEKVRRIGKGLYHRPLLLTLVNSVNTEDADLLLFFREIEKIGKDKTGKKMFDNAKKEILKSFKDNPRFTPFEEELEFPIDENLLLKLEYKDILKHVFNAKTPGGIEVLKIPENKKELVFKLRTADKPFASIKIGDISNWLKEKLSGYEINESFENESVFEKINHDDSDINILMGSRSFYEGWDSNRPNILLFVNIGVGTDARKFVLQSVGRGVRIEPIKDRRRRLKNLHNAKSIDDTLYSKVSKLALPIETLFIFGTNTANLKEVIATLKAEKTEKDLGTNFVINDAAEKCLLLIPAYRDSEKILAEDKDIQKYSIHDDDFELAKNYFEYIGDKVALMGHDCELKVLEKVKTSLGEKEKYYSADADYSLGQPDLLLSRIVSHYSLRQKEFDNFKGLQDEIVHFKKIKYLEDSNLINLLDSIKKVRSYPEKEVKYKQLKLEFEKDHNTDKFAEGVKELEATYQSEASFRDLKIKYIANHYYAPLIYSEEEKVKYINHVIKKKSEVKFINDLEAYTGKNGNIFEKQDWWMFSKIDESLDEVYIPYYNPKENKISRFYPDFIFWMKKGKDYRIIFIDPKGTEHKDADRKINGYTRLFEEDGKEKTFKYNSFNVRVKLLLKTTDMVLITEEYKKYWFDNFKEFATRIS